MVAGCKSSGIFCGLITAKSFSGMVEMTNAADSMPSKKVTSKRWAVEMTWKLVKMVPSSTMTTPEPTPSSFSPALGFLGSVPKARTRTTEGQIKPAALAVREGRSWVAKVCNTAASMSFWVNTWRGVPKRSLAHHMAPPMAKPMSSMAQRSWRTNQLLNPLLGALGAGLSARGAGTCAGTGWLA